MFKSSLIKWSSDPLKNLVAEQPSPLLKVNLKFGLHLHLFKTPNALWQRTLNVLINYQFLSFLHHEQPNTRFIWKIMGSGTSDFNIFIISVGKTLNLLLFCVLSWNYLEKLLKNQMIPCMVSRYIEVQTEKQNSTGKLQTLAINLKKLSRKVTMQNLLVHINTREGRAVLQAQ